MSFFKFIDDVIKPAQKIAQGAEKRLTEEATREASKAADRIAKQFTRKAEVRAQGLVSRFLTAAPENETAAEYYARTGQVREDDWGQGGV